MAIEILPAVLRVKPEGSSLGQQRSGLEGRAAAMW
jgi:hypothetical protein